MRLETVLNLQAVRFSLVLAHHGLVRGGLIELIDVIKKMVRSVTDHYQLEMWILNIIYFFLSA